MRTLILVAITMLLTGQALAQGDAAAGQALYATCTACHGAQGEGNKALNAPRLTHLEPVYIVAQLEKFKNGQRGGANDSATAKQMAPMAATLADATAMTNVAAYIGTLSGGQSAATVEGNATLGGDYYNQFCGACHGAGAVGNPALNSPRLVGGDDWYVVSQLESFRGGQRGSHPDDRTGRQMKAMAAILPGDQAVRDVAAYIRSLEN